MGCIHSAFKLPNPEQPPWPIYPWKLDSPPCKRFIEVWKSSIPDIYLDPLNTDCISGPFTNADLDGHLRQYSQMDILIFSALCMAALAVFRINYHRQGRSLCPERHSTFILTPNFSLGVFLGVFLPSAMLSNNLQYLLIVKANIWICNHWDISVLCEDLDNCRGVVTAVLLQVLHLLWKKSNWIIAVQNLPWTLSCILKV